MRGKFAQLQRIENDHEIREETDPAFVHCLKKGLLLALRERGTLNAAQYRQAEEKLEQMRRAQKNGALE